MLSCYLHYTKSEYEYLFKCGDWLRQTGDMRGLHWPTVMTHAVDCDEFRDMVYSISWANGRIADIYWKPELWKRLADFIEEYSKRNPQITTLYQKVLRSF